MQPVTEQRGIGQLLYQIDASHPESHRLGLVLTFELAALGPLGPDRDCVLFLPTWTPGSYLIREFSRHLSRVTAVDADSGEIVNCAKVSKNRFRLVAPTKTKRVRVCYGVYARDLSVRTADVTADHAYWNHACLLLWPLGRAGMTARLEITYPAAWSLACALPVAPSPSTAHVDDGGQGAVLQRTALLADDLDHVVDSPCLLGTLVRLDWTVGRVPHSAVLDGLASVPVPATLVDDLKKIVERTASIFGGELPYQRYVFLCLFAADGHGGLEHSESTTLLMSRTAIATPKGYRDFLSLAAHEHFHAWNAKRMRPVEFWTYDYERENYTELLWLIEGWTAYYDDLICHRAGLISREDYLGIVAKNVNTMLAAPGRHHLSLSESSFDAWIRLYRPDENSRNSSQNYYGNGAVAAMCLDLLIRRRTSGAASLDDIVRTLYASTFAHGRGYTADDIARIVATVAGADVVTALTALVSDRLDPELNSLVAAFGLRVVSTGADKPYLGITFDAGRTTIAAINLDSPAYRSGLSPGDEVLAIAGLRVDGDRWAEVFQAVARIDHPLEVLVARRGVIARRVATPTSSPPTISIEIDPVATAGQTALRDGWLPAAC